MLLVAPALAVEPTLVRPWRGRERIHVRPVVAGLPVCDAEAIYERDASGLRLVRPADPSALRTDATPTVAPDVADIPLADPALCWVGGRLTWEIPVFGVLTNVVGTTWVDAHDGTAVTHWRRAADLGRVYLVAPTPDDLSDVMLAERTDPAVLESPNVDVTSLTWDGAESRQERLATPDEGGDFLYDPAEGDDPFAEVNTFHHLDAASTWLADTFGYEPALWVEAIVNWEESPGTPYDNAWSEYTGERHRTLVFGEGTADDFAHDPQILVHEYGHQVLFDETRISDRMDYPFALDERGIFVGPGALTEGLPDYFGATYLDDPILGSHSRWELRDADNDHDCVSWSMGEAHTDASVVSGAAWALRDGLGADAADAIVYGSLGLLPGSPTYADWGAALLEAADSLAADGVVSEDQRAQTEEILAERRLLECGREVTVGDAERIRMWTVGAEYAGEGACELMRGIGVHMTPPFQVRLPEPADDVTGLDLSFAWSPWDPEDDAIVDGDLDYTVVARVGEPVEFEVERMDLAGYAFNYVVAPSAADVVVEGSPATVHLDPAGEDLYVSVLHANCPVTWLDIDVAWDRPAPPEPQACGCATGSARPSLLLALVALFRRRG